ncbi:hypothetical protein IscW_ISCW010104 [Ixodes scapularis]|uniref:Secreted protein n=1 Tax=Ixodes scapularis TaxID=6945 RepID=B7PY23_IXOSC|nr:hypothetical protein IscW_ISCW010104 [Ixodes scapularis]|eukprot:XP_002402392.1 hypothetical protein IscW_ISCW010104 [Ixodes scapularis]
MNLKPAYIIAARVFFVLARGGVVSPSGPNDVCFRLVADVLALAHSIQQLSMASRRARTGLWCALTTTLLLQQRTFQQPAAPAATGAASD